MNKIDNVRKTPVRLILTIKTKMHYKLKMRALQRNMTMTQIVNELIESYLNDENKSE